MDQLSGMKHKRPNGLNAFPICKAFAMALLCFGWGFAQPAIFPNPKSIVCSQDVVLLGAGNKANFSVAIDTALDARSQNEILRMVGTLASGIGADSSEIILTRGSALASTPVIIAVGVNLPVFGQVGVGAPNKAEAYSTAVESLGAQRVICLAGHDAPGVFWGIQSLLQLASTKQDTLFLSACAVQDWPDMSLRMSSSLPNDTNLLAFAAREGRLNASLINLQETGGAFISGANLRKQVLLLKKAGMKAIGHISHVRIHAYLKAAEARDYVCPVEDAALLRSYCDTAVSAGVDGLSMGFDDLSEAQLRMYAAGPCPHLSGMSIAANHAAVSKIVTEEAAAHAIPLVFVVPGIYTWRATSAYRRITGATRDAYLLELCGAAGLDSVNFFYCEYRKDSLAAIMAGGLKNFVWWNNGPWSAVHPEVWGAYISFAKMGYSWDMYDYNALSRNFEERIDTAAMHDLATLKQKTGAAFFGTGDPIGLALGGYFAWNNSAYIASETSYRNYLARRLFGTDIASVINTWNSQTPPLWIKSRKLEMLSSSDRAQIAVLQGVRQSLSGPTLAQVRIANPMQAVLSELNDYGGFCENMESLSVAASTFYADTTGPHIVARLSAQSIGESGSGRIALSQAGPAVKIVAYQGKEGLLFNRDNYASRADSCFDFSGHSFSVEAFLTRALPTWSKIAGTSPTIREIYLGTKGWAVGIEGATNKVRFTLQDKDSIVSTVVSAKAVARYVPAHIVAVRNWDAKTISLYVNGKHEGTAAEAGGGIFRNPSFSIGRDIWTGTYFQGVLHSLTVYDTALSETDIAEKYQAGISNAAALPGPSGGLRLAGGLQGDLYIGYTLPQGTEGRVRLFNIRGQTVFQRKIAPSGPRSGRLAYRRGRGAAAMSSGLLIGVLEISNGNRLTAKTVRFR